MPIKKLTTDAMVAQQIKQGVERLEKAVVNTLCYAGEMCLNAVRGTNSYKDQTGNLRSSLGYIVVSNGKVVMTSSFNTVKNGSEGAANGRKYAKELVSQFPDATALIVVAGMNYAQYVAAKGYDVLDSGELLAEKLVPRLLKQLEGIA